MKILAVCAFVFLSAYAQIVISATVIELNSATQSPLNTDDQSGFLDEVAAEAFRRINIELKTIRLPAERALKNANKGIIDGELVRIGGLSKIYPNLIQVPEKIMDMKFVVFSYEPINLEKGWLSLSGKTVSYINGWKIIENNIPADSEVTKVSDVNSLFNLMKKKRTDYVVYEQWSGLYFLKKNLLKDVRLRAPPLEVKEMFIYLHKKHKALVPQLAKALLEMKQDGSYNSLVSKHLLSLE